MNWSIRFRNHSAQWQVYSFSGPSISISILHVCAGDKPSSRYIATRVHNVEGRGYQMHYISNVICLQRVTWIPTLCTWLSQGVKHSIFLRTLKSSGVFHEFHARFFMNAHYVLWSTGVFSRYCTHVHFHLRPQSPIINYLNQALLLVNVWILACDFLKTSYTGCIAHLPILSFLPYCILLIAIRSIMVNLWYPQACTYNNTVHQQVVLVYIMKQLTIKGSNYQDVSMHPTSPIQVCIWVALYIPRLLLVFRCSVLHWKTGKSLWTRLVYERVCASWYVYACM